jgi:hypothetical protein
VRVLTRTSPRETRSTLLASRVSLSGWGLRRRCRSRGYLRVVRRGPTRQRGLLLQAQEVGHIPGVLGIGHDRGLEVPLGEIGSAQPRVGDAEPVACVRPRREIRLRHLEQRDGLRQMARLQRSPPSSSAPTVLAASCGSASAAGRLSLYIQLVNGNDWQPPSETATSATLASLTGVFIINLPH